MNKVIRGTLLSTLAVGLIVSVSSQPALAGKKNPKPINNTVDLKQNVQRAEINAGVQSGALTGKETKVLNNKQQDIANREARYYASGGKLNRSEVRDLNRMQNQADKKIDKLTTDYDGPGKRKYNKAWKAHKKGCNK